MSRAAALAAALLAASPAVLLLGAGGEPAPRKAGAAELQAPTVLIGPAAETMPEPEPWAEAPQDEIETVARVLWAEARGVPSDTEVACVAWTIVNRVDAGAAEDIIGAATAPGQYAYDPDAPLESRLLWLAEDVLERWYNDAPGRVLPPEYLWFQGDGEHNWFRDGYLDGDVWGYDLGSPYES